MWNVFHWDRKTSTLSSLLRQHAVCPDGKNKLWCKTFWIYTVKFFKYICLIASNESTFKVLFISYLTKRDIRAMGCVILQWSPLVAKASGQAPVLWNTSKQCFSKCIQMKHNLTFPPTPWLCVVIYLVKFNFVFIQFVQTSNVHGHLWVAFDVLETLFFSTK